MDTQALSLAISALGLVAVLSTLLFERTRAVWRSVFRSPRQSSVLISIGGDTLELKNVAPEDVDKLIEAFVKRHAEQRQSVEEQAPGLDGGGQRD